MPKQIDEQRGRLSRLLADVKPWLRSAMPRLAVASGLLLVGWAWLSDTAVFKGTVLGSFLGKLTFWTVLVVCVYYGLTALRWLKRKLLWRVRRRLVITYLFLGLTPIILMTLLGMLIAFGGSGQGMSRIITAQINTTEKQTRAAAKSVADAITRLPGTADDGSMQAWLDEHTLMLSASLPGAQAMLWRGGVGDEIVSVGQEGPPRFVSSADARMATAMGGNSSLGIGRLPNWMRGRTEWSGLTFTSPENPGENFASPSIRATVRGFAGNRPFALLLVVPVSRQLIEQYREATGIYVRPFFVSRVTTEDAGRSSPSGQEHTENPDDEGEVEDLFRTDQFGEAVGDSFYVVMLPATNWATGETREHLSFLFDWSWSLASKQFWGHGEPGELWRRALFYVGIAFLVLELLALASSAWMTRAVTGTVHKLYGAVGFIKRGDFSHRVSVRSHDQLGELAAAFNDMSANIEVLLEERVVRERLEREVEIAAEVQAQLFPRRVPDLTSVEVAAECRAARGVAGDYYDYIEVVPGLVAFALGDVSGKGVSASLVMSNLQASLRAQTTIAAERMQIAQRAVSASMNISGDGSGMPLTRVATAADVEGVVAQQVTSINQQLCQSTESNRFATLFLALYDDSTRRFRYTNAGHHAPLLVRADGTVERLTAGGMMVGAFEWAEYEEQGAALEPGDLLLVFSDGISEAENEECAEYGEERLMRFAIEHRTLSATDLRDAIFEEVDLWSGARERDDDQTLTIIKGDAIHLKQ